MENKNLAAARSYYQLINEGKFNEDAYYSLFTEDVEIYYPKFGFDKGREGVIRFGNKVRNLIDSLQFELEKFNYVVADNYVIAEGFEKGATYLGLAFPDGIVSHGKFCSVFEFENNQIKRMHCYLDPDFAAEDVERLVLLTSENVAGNTKWNKNNIEKAANSTDQETRAIVDEFYDFQFGRKKGNITDLFAEEVDWDLPGNKEKFPWTGSRRTKQEIAQFFQELYDNIKSEKFEIDFIAVNGENATVVGQLSSQILKYNKVFSTAFVVIFKVVNGKIVKYHFLEDSYKLNEEMK